MIDALTPTRTTTPRFDRIADDRWEFWEGDVIVWLQRQPYGNQPRIGTVQKVHRQWLATLLSRGIPIRQVRRAALDDPREPRAVLEQRVTEYTDRRLRRSTDNAASDSQPS